MELTKEQLQGQLQTEVFVSQKKDEELGKLLGEVIRLRAFNEALVTENERLKNELDNGKKEAKKKE